jgi:predicted subunit of tRNA(5-methylaminomethyl-2-thiouridylate) methyltransferase
VDRVDQGVVVLELQTVRNLEMELQIQVQVVVGLGKTVVSLVAVVLEL